LAAGAAGLEAVFGAAAGLGAGAGFVLLSAPSTPSQPHTTAIVTVTEKRPNRTEFISAPFFLLIMFLCILELPR
jgi:hypothetical protein